MATASAADLDTLEVKLRSHSAVRKSSVKLAIDTWGSRLLSCQVIFLTAMLFAWVQLYRELDRPLLPITDGWHEGIWTIFNCILLSWQSQMIGQANAHTMLFAGCYRPLSCVTFHCCYRSDWSCDPRTVEVKPKKLGNMLYHNYTREHASPQAYIMYTFWIFSKYSTSMHMHARTHTCICV